MRFIDEYRDPRIAQDLLREIATEATRQWTLMEVCGGQTHTLVRQGIDVALPPTIELVHGPGCPVCVTPLGLIDRAIEVSRTPGTVLTSFGDMLRVPGSREDLLSARASGADVRVVYSPLDAVEIARREPDARVVFFAVGFETTAPANAMAVLQAHRLGIDNFSILVAHVLVPPAMAAILTSEGNRVQAFLAPGHVCAVQGWREYESIAHDHRVPIVVTGFEPLDLLEGLLMAVRQLESGRGEVENQYARAVGRDGNLAARSIVDEVFEVTDREWRGIGVLPQSGLRLRDRFSRHDADLLFPASHGVAAESGSCIAGEILRGRAKPDDCPAFSEACTPERPLGAPMVSSEGACAAYFLAGRSRRGAAV
jgi:hydrogenase expression/formation protein HypD